MTSKGITMSKETRELYEETADKIAHSTIMEEYPRFAKEQRRTIIFKIGEVSLVIPKRLLRLWATHKEG